MKAEENHGSTHAPRRALGVSVLGIVQLAGLLTLWSAAGCGGAADSGDPASVSAVQGALAASPVRLLYGKAYYYYGCSAFMTWGSVAEVEDLAYDKESTVAYQVGGGTAREARAGYLRTLPSGRELWSFSQVGANGTTQLRVRYRARGREMWDRNDGWDYWARVDAVDGAGLLAVESPLGPGSRWWSQTPA